MSEINENQIKQRLEAISSFKATPQVTARDLDRVRQTLTSQQHQQKTKPQNTWKMITRTKITELAAAAVVIITAIVGLNWPGGESAGTLFAAAIENIRQARTFSCKLILGDDQNDKNACVQEFMFKEPDIMRTVNLSGQEQFIGQTSIVNYSKGQQLTFVPKEKRAALSDDFFHYTIDEKTGKLKLDQLDTNMRDRVLKLTAEAVEDIGKVALDGKIVRKLQSRGDDKVTTVWLDIQSNLPMQIKIQWLDPTKPPVTYASIKIDAELSDELFSLDPPEGYHLIKHSSWPAVKRKISAKMRFLSMACIMYQETNKRFPKELTELDISKEVLRVVLAAPDNPDGPAIIKYRQPRPDGDWAREVILYETYDKSLDGKIVACFVDGHCELEDQKHFGQLLE